MGTRKETKMEEKEVYVRILEFGKIHRGILLTDGGQEKAQVPCRPYGWGVIPSNEFRLKNVKIIPDNIYVEQNDICKTCLRMKPGISTLLNGELGSFDRSRTKLSNICKTDADVKGEKPETIDENEIHPVRFTKEQISYISSQIHEHDMEYWESECEEVKDILNTIEKAEIDEKM